MPNNTLPSLETKPNRRTKVNNKPKYTDYQAE